MQREKTRSRVCELCHRKMTEEREDETGVGGGRICGQNFTRMDFHDERVKHYHNISFYNQRKALLLFAPDVSSGEKGTLLKT